MIKNKIGMFKEIYLFLFFNLIVINKNIKNLTKVYSFINPPGFVLK